MYLQMERFLRFQSCLLSEICQGHLGTMWAAWKCIGTEEIHVFPRSCIYKKAVSSEAEIGTYTCILKDMSRK